MPTNSQSTMGGEQSPAVADLRFKIADFRLNERCCFQSEIINLKSTISISWSVFSVRYDGVPFA